MQTKTMVFTKADLGIGMILGLLCDCFQQPFHYPSSSHILKKHILVLVVQVVRELLFKSEDIPCSLESHRA